MVRPVSRGFPPPFTFITRRGFDTRTLARMLDSLVRVSRRVACGHYASVLAPEGAVLGRGWSHAARGCNTARRRPRSPGLSATAATDAGPTAEEYTGPDGTG